MGAGRRELITTYKSAVVAKPVLDPIVVEDSEGDGCLPDATRTDESDRFEVFSKSGDLLDQLVASETGPESWRRRFPQRDTTQT